MTIEKPLWQQNNTYPARLDRALIAAMFDEGILSGFTVAQRGAGANMSVDVTAGKAVVQGDDQADQGNYYVRSTATENVAVSAAPGSNSRYDIVVLKINDPNAGGPAGDNMQIQVIAGTAAASPVVPSTPASALLLASIGPILTSTTTITNAMITNVATTARSAFDLIDALAITTAKLANGAVTGAKIANDTIGTGNIADGQITSAKIAAGAVGTTDIADGAVTQPKVTTTWTQVSNGTSHAKWMKLGTTVFVFTFGTGNLTVNLPVGARPSTTLQVQTGVSLVQIATNGDITGIASTIGTTFVYEAA